MANITFERDSSALGRGARGGFAAIGVFINDGLQTMGPLGRRVALTAFGAVLALSLGAATASAFRLPAEITDPTQPQDQALAQVELPSEVAARAYALENPPSYTVAADRTEDALPTVDASTIDPATSDDDTAKPAVSYTVPAAEPASDANTAAATPTASASVQTADADAVRQD